MRNIKQSRNRSERGIALFVTMMVLLLLAALTAAMILLASGESTSVGQQRQTALVNYAAIAGPEEARARMLAFHPNSLSKLSPPVALPGAIGQVIYITNPAAGETVNPTDLSAGNVYADTEYQTEFGTPVNNASVTVTTVSSIQPLMASLTSIPYKWVRITLKTEQAARADINGDGVLDNITPVTYDGRRQNVTGTGDLVYRLTALAVVPGNKRQHMSQEDVAGSFNGFNYALATGSECEFETAGGAAALITGNVGCNGQMEVKGNLSVTNGSVQSASTVSGPGTISMSGGNQVRANGSVTATVTGGGSPNVVSASGTVTPFQTPASPTPPPLPPNTMPNPNANSLIASVSQTNPPGTCVGGNVVIDLGNASPPKVFEFTGASYTSACGTTINPANFPATIQFAGTGTIWFSASSGDIKFSNNFGTLATPIDLNIIARPRDNTVGAVEVEFAGTVNNIRGLIYVQGEIETEPAKPKGGVAGSCAGVPSASFVLSGSMIAYGPEGEFEAENCIANLSINYNARQLSNVNPPPGFNGLLVTGIISATVLSWHDVNY